MTAGTLHESQSAVLKMPKRPFLRDILWKCNYNVLITFLKHYFYIVDIYVIMSYLTNVTAAFVLQFYFKQVFLKTGLFLQPSTCFILFV